MIDTNKILHLIGVESYKLRVNEHPEQLENTKGDWSILESEVKNCTKCSLHKSRTQTVFGFGNKDSDWLFIGEAPGKDEDLQGEPFVGRSGRLLNEIIFSIGLSREEIYIANILKCRPTNNRKPLPKDRKPLPKEINKCSPYLEQQIKMISPKIIIAVGETAAQYLLGSDLKIGKLRGTVHSYSSENIPVVVVYHPAYLLRSPSQKYKVLSDLQLAKGVMK